MKLRRCQCSPSIASREAWAVNEPTDSRTGVELREISASNKTSSLVEKFRIMQTGVSDGLANTVPSDYSI